MKNISDYEDIIEITDYKSKLHKRMTMEQRASQFNSFQALTGFNDCIKDASIIYDERIILDDQFKDVIKARLDYLAVNLDKEINVSIKYFLNQCNNRGSIMQVYDTIKNIDSITKAIFLGKGQKIAFDDILNIEIL